MTAEDKPRRGRQATGQAMTTTQRAAKRDKALVESGGRVLRNVRLCPEATIALSAITKSGVTERGAIETLLIDWYRLNVVSHDK